MSTAYLDDYTKRAKRRKFALMLMILVLVLCVAGFGAWNLFGDGLFGSEPDYQSAQAMKPRPKVAASSTPQQKTAPNNASASVGEPALARRPEAAASVATEELTKLHSQLELKKAELEVLEVEHKIAVLGGAGGHPSGLAPVLSAVPPEFQPVLPQLPAAASPRLPTVVSIEGMDGDLQALLATTNGLELVRRGDRIAAGRIERIGSAQVVLRGADGKPRQLAFEE